MGAGRNKVIATFFFVTVGMFYSFSVIKTRGFSWELNAKQPAPARAHNFAVDTPTCQIPILEPLHPSVAHMVHRQSDLSCSGEVPLVVVDGLASLSINNLSSRAGSAKCQYMSISRIAENSFETGKKKAMPKVLNVTSEFVKVECRDGNRVVYVDFFPFIIKKPEVEKRVANRSKVWKEKVKERFNVLLLGLDSVSKNQYLRHMKQTDKFIRENLTFIELSGFNKVGKNTYPNMVPFLAGKNTSEVPDLSKVPANVLPLVWKEYANAGYRILFSEDIPQISIFNYAKKGFKEQPTDYYLRPFGVAVEKSPLVKKGKRGCFNRRPETSVILKWTEDYFDTFSSRDLFALNFITRLSHDNFNELSYQDKPVRDFLQTMHDKGHLNNTIVVFFGDHGYRFGDIRTTYVGRMEDKLPLAFLFVPPDFPAKYPELYQNLKTNEHRLTTPFDMYAVLQDILHFDGQVKQPEAQARSISLFGSEIPLNRTCSDAAIDPQYCACIERRQVDAHDQRVQKAAAEVVSTINKLTAKSRKVCAEFRLQSVVEASMQTVAMGESDDPKTDHSTNFQVTLRVSPSGGIFEGTVWCTETKKKTTFTVDPNVERVNMYGNQSICVNVSALKPFCYCIVKSTNTTTTTTTTSTPPPYNITVH